MAWLPTYPRSQWVCGTHANGSPERGTARLELPAHCSGRCNSDPHEFANANRVGVKLNSPSITPFEEWHGASLEIRGRLTWIRQPLLRLKAVAPAAMCAFHLCQSARR